MLIELEVLVPRRDNRGRRFTRTTWRRLESRLRELGGGFTREDGSAGQWVLAERVYHDTSRRYTVAIQSWRQFPGWLEIVEWARIEFRQDALYIRVQGVAEILREN